MKKFFLKNNKGQALVEFAVIVPILLLILMGIFEFGRIFNTYLIINHASREGARSAVVGHEDDYIVNTIIDSMFHLDPTNMTATISPDKSLRARGSNVTVNLKYDVDVIIPIIEDVIPDPLRLETQTIMRVE